MADSRPEQADLAFLRAEQPDPPVTVIRDVRACPGSEGRFESLMGELIREASRQPGHLGATIVRPRGHDSTGVYKFIYKFDRRSNLAKWHDSKTRARLFEPVAALVESDQFSEYPGLETWFDLPPRIAPPKWKTTLVSWASIYVLVMVMSYAIRATGAQLSIPLAGLVLSGVIVPLVAYVVGPLLGKALRGWLMAGAQAE